jgi:hypothetical protein
MSASLPGFCVDEESSSTSPRSLRWLGIGNFLGLDADCASQTGKEVENQSKFK